MNRSNTLFLETSRGVRLGPGRVRNFLFGCFLGLAILLHGFYPETSFGQLYGKEKKEVKNFTGRIGVGKGVPYGERGINLEFGLLELYSLSGGIGKKEREGRHWVVGVRAYSEQKKQGFNPRFSIFYGALGEVDDANGNPAEVLKGYSFGAGFDWMLTDRLSFDFDTFIFRKLEEVEPGFEKDEGKKISAGFGISF